MTRNSCQMWPLVRTAGVIAIAVITSFPVNAALVSGPDIIAAPASVIDDPPGATNDHQQGFNERQGVLLAAPILTDSGVIPAGTWVNSHMIFLNTVGTTPASDQGRVWRFDGNVIGVMSNGTGSLEVNSSPVLGAAGTIYPAAPFPARGMEAADSYVVAGNQITVNMSVTEPGDWIRVVTEGIELSLDLHPTSCPNPLNTKKRGVIPAAILGTGTFDPSTIDPTSLLLEGVAPLRWNLADVAAPFDGDLCGCTTEGPDGWTDLTLKFYGPDVVAAIAPVTLGDEVVLTLTGTLMNGTPFVAQDCMVIRGNGVGSRPTEILDTGLRSTATAGDGITQTVSWGAMKDLYRNP